MCILAVLLKVGRKAEQHWNGKSGSKERKRQVATASSSNHHSALRLISKIPNLLFSESQQKHRKSAAADGQRVREKGKGTIPLAVLLRSKVTKRKRNK